MMPTTELLVLSSALLGVAFSSGVLLSCKTNEATVTVEPSVSSTPVALDPSDPEALRRAAAVVATWNQKDPALTARVLKENGVVITDPATFQAMADAGLPGVSPSAVASASAAPSAFPQQRPAPRRQPSSPMA